MVFKMYALFLYITSLKTRYSWLFKDLESSMKRSFFKFSLLNAPVLNPSQHIAIYCACFCNTQPDPPLT